MSITIRPLTLKQANALVASLHRHHKPIQGHRFTIGPENGTLRGADPAGSKLTVQQLPKRLFSTDWLLDNHFT